VQIRLKNHNVIEVRTNRKEDFIHIHKLNAEEEWNNLVEKKECTKNAWYNSDLAYVAEHHGEIIANIRGLTDQSITLFICELLVKRRFQGIGGALLQYVHGLYPETRIEKLTNTSSHTYYEQKGYRPFYGFQKDFSGTLMRNESFIL
jgi:predicted N-acetyltransferase YhbS